MVMERDTRRMRGERPYVFTNLKALKGIDVVDNFIVSAGMLRAA
jgi:urease accessory protein